MTVRSKIIRNGKLVPQKEWEEHIAALCNKTPDQTEDEAELRDAIVVAVKERIPDEPFGIFFSGGVDSSLIALLCKRYSSVPFTCYTVGFCTGDMADAGDTLWARKAAAALDVRHVEKVYNLAEAQAIIEETVRILPRPAVIDTGFVVNVGVGSVVVAAASLAKEKVFFGGIGTEEIFAGYERHANADDVNDECWRGLSAMYARDFVRDAAIGSAFGIDLLTPFLDLKVIIEAMRIPGRMKIDISQNVSQKKIVLRQIAQELGLPENIAWRKKNAAQYGSRFDHALSKLAKKNGFSKKAEYLRHMLEKQSI